MTYSLASFPQKFNPILFTKLPVLNTYYNINIFMYYTNLRITSIISGPRGTENSFVFVDIIWMRDPSAFIVLFNLFPLFCQVLFTCLHIVRHNSILGLYLNAWIQKMYE